MEEKKARIPTRHTGVGVHSGGPAPLPSCVSLFTHRMLTVGSAWPRMSHTQGHDMCRRKKNQEAEQGEWESGSEWSTERGGSNKKGNIRKRKRRRRWCGGNSQRNLISLLSRLKWKKTHTSLQWIKTGWYTVSWFLCTFLEGKSGFWRHKQWRSQDFYILRFFCFFVFLSNICEETL